MGFIVYSEVDIRTIKLIWYNMVSIRLVKMILFFKNKTDKTILPMRFSMGLWRGVVGQWMYRN
jgi:hypothetical protein